MRPECLQCGAPERWLLIDSLAKRGIAYVPFFPLGGFTPLQSSALDAVAAVLEATPMQVAQVWLLERAPDILLIPETSSPEHLRLNLQAAALRIPSELIPDLDAIGRAPGTLIAGESENPKGAYSLFM